MTSKAIIDKINKIFSSPRGDPKRKKIPRIVESPIDAYVGRNLRKIREEEGISQRKLGELVGVASQQIQKYESGRNRITAGRLFELSRIFKKPIFAFYTGYIVDTQFYNFDSKDEPEYFKPEKYKKIESDNLVEIFKKIKSKDLRDRIIKMTYDMLKSENPF